MAAIITIALAWIGCADMPGMPGGVRLTGDQGVSPATTAASGNAEIAVAGDGSVAGNIKTTCVDGTMAHVPIGTAGKSGPLLFAMTKAADGVWSIAPRAKLTAEQMKAYQAGELYVNVHSAADKGGEIRTQLKPQWRDRATPAGAWRGPGQPERTSPSIGLSVRIRGQVHRRSAGRRRTWATQTAIRASTDGQRTLSPRRSAYVGPVPNIQCPRAARSARRRMVGGVLHDFPDVADGSLRPAAALILDAFEFLLGAADRLAGALLHLADGVL